jgi:phosphate transport system substrate-binding protein
MCPRSFTLRSRQRGLAWIVALLAAFALIAAGCGDDDDETGSTGTTAGGAAGESDIDYSALSGSLAGSGATVPAAFYEEVIAEFQAESPLQVTYAGGGSSKGKQDLADAVSIWAGTDSLVKDEDLSKYDSGGGIFYFPTVAAPITISYNLDGVDELNLSPDTIAGIFQRTITTWDAPEIAADNEGASLPSTPIVVARRADGSGTTSNFSKYLTKAAPDTWTLGSSDTLDWPADTQAGQGNGGVAQIVADTPGAVGYVDLSDAEETGLSTASIENAAGNFVAPTLEGATAALEGAEVEDDLTYDPLNASGDDAYPITAPTWVITFQSYGDATTVENLKGWLTFLLTTGETIANDVDFASLPSELQERAVAQIDEITAG